MRSTWSGTVVAESMDDDAMATDQAAREDQDKMTMLANKRARIYEVSWGRIGGVRGAANGDREVGVRGGIRFRIARPTNGCRWPLSLPSCATRSLCGPFPVPDPPLLRLVELCVPVAGFASVFVLRPPPHTRSTPAVSVARPGLSVRCWRCSPLHEHDVALVGWSVDRGWGVVWVRCALPLPGLPIFVRRSCS